MLTKYINFTQKIGDTDYNELQVSVYYEKQKINYFTGNFEKGGLYVLLKPIKRVHGLISCSITSTDIYTNGFKCLVLEMARNNNKKIEKYTNLLDDKTLNELMKNYEQKQFQKIKTILADLSKLL